MHPTQYSSLLPKAETQLLKTPSVSLIFTYYFFKLILGYELPLNDDDRSVRETVTTAWVNFITYGNPNPTWEPEINGNYWNITGPIPEMDRSQKILDRFILWQQILNST